MKKKIPSLHALKDVHPSKIMLPVLIGIGVVFYLLLRDFDREAFQVMHFTWKAVFFLFCAFLLIVFRDLGYIIRLRVLSEGKFSWRQAFRVIMLWEFTSAITPSAVGGTSVAILYVHKEGLSIGKSTAVVMATSLLDELFFLIAFPLVWLMVGTGNLFHIQDLNSGGLHTYSSGFMYFTIIGYSLKFAFVLLIAYGLFVRPRGLKWLLMVVFRLPILRKWRNGAMEAGNEIVTSSYELRSKPFRFWLKAFGATCFSWLSRYWIVNAIMIAFFVVPHHFVIFSRQIVLWIMMLVSPTPGGSGFTEYAFTQYFGEFLPVEPHLIATVTVSLALVWRLVSYYPYLIIGAIILPRWIKEKFIGDHKPLD